MSEPLKPLSIRREGQGLRIVWNDGYSGYVSFNYLRSKCPCATCNEDRAKPADPFKVLSPQEVATLGNLHPVAMPARGHYAYQIVWNDGHDTGIYKLEFLRQLCESEPAPPSAATPG